MEGGHYGTMNGDIPSVPVTTLAGIASLTDLLPELPVPGPTVHGSIGAGQNIIFHAALSEEASQYLSVPNDVLASNLALALSNTPVDHIQLNSKNAIAAHSQNQVPLHQTSLLANSLCRINPNLFYHQQDATWSSHCPSLNNGDYEQQLPQPQPQEHPQLQASQLLQQVPSSDFDGSAACKIATAVKHEPSNGPLPDLTSVNKKQVSAMSKFDNIKLTSCSITLEKLSEEDLDKAFKAGNSKRTEQLGEVTTPRLRRGNSTKYNQESDSGDNDVSYDSSSDPEDYNLSKKSKKFFRSNDKEREEEKRKRKEESKRKRKLEDDDYVHCEDQKRRRGADSSIKTEQLDTFVPKKVTRKIERKLHCAATPNLDIDELMESTTYHRFNKAVELIFENMEDVNMQELGTDQDLESAAELPPEILIPKYQLQDLCNETAKLKSMGATEAIPVEKIIKLLNILELNIRDGSRVSPLSGDEEDDEEGDKLWHELAMERVVRAADSTLTVLHILTSKNMPKPVFIDDVIDRAAMFLRFQLANTIYPSYDPVYKEMVKSKTGCVYSMKKKRSYAHTVKDKNILALYNKITEITSMMAELVHIQLLTDTTVLHISSLGVAPFFVENIPELQLAALKLVTNVFSKYEKHRKLLLDDILASIARLPSSKRSLRTYRLKANSYIQMLTALVLQLIQCVVVLPQHLHSRGQQQPRRANKEDPDLASENQDEKIDKDVLINNKYNMAMATAHQFLTVFLKKCGSKNEDIDYRPLFENFVQDLLTTVNTPEWPAAELLLSLMGHVLREKFKDRSTEMALRTSSLEYLGVVAARLRRDVVQSKTKLDYIDSIVKLIKEEEEKENSELSLTPKKSKKNTISASADLDPEDERTLFLQRVLLDYLAVTGGEDDQATLNARHFYICQWYRDANAVAKKPKKPKKKKDNNQRISGSKKKRRPQSEEDSDSDSGDEGVSDDDLAEDEKNISDSKKAELYRLREERKHFLVSKVPPFGFDKGQKDHVLSTHIDHESAHLIVKYLSSKRPFFNSFNSYLQDILNVLNEQSTHVRTKALKCMAVIVAEDPDVLLRQDMQKGVQYSFVDASTLVREAAVDLLGKFILHKLDLIDQYYKIITDRILDTGVSVRKRVIKILKDICLEFPTYKKIPEICVKMIRRINDEEGIRKLVMEVFQNMWFIPVREQGRNEKDAQLLLTRARNITDVVVECRDTGLEWFEQLLQTLFRPKDDKDDATVKNTEPPPQLVLACQQIVDCLVESILRMEESNFDMSASKDSEYRRPAENSLANKSLGSNNRIVACLTTLYLFAKIRPQLLVHHVQTLQPYLSVSCRAMGDYQIISDVARTLELVVPLIKHPSEIFLAQLEEDAIKLIFMHDRKVISACVSCLGSIVNSVTKNYKLVRDCFVKYFGYMIEYRRVYEANPSDPRLIQVAPKFRRAMFTVGLLIKHFNFSSKQLYQGLAGGADTVEEVFETMFFFMLHESKEIQLDTLHSLGFICIRHHIFMMESKLRQFYLDILTEDFYPVPQKIKVLNNIESYLIEEDIRMLKQDSHWIEYGTKENLKEMGDVMSGMASTVIQVYLKCILEALIHPDVVVRHSAMKVVTLVLSQGLVHPVQIVPYLICMSTDPEKKISHAADKELQEIEKKYPGFNYMKMLQGIRLSFRLQELLQSSNSLSKAVRGFRQYEGDAPSALNGYLYSILKNTKTQRRGILTSLLKQFDDTAKTSLGMMLYLADNLAYIPYTVVDEPLFVIHHIDIMISVAGSNLLQAFKEALKPPPSCEHRLNLETGKSEYIYDEDLDDDFNSVFSRLPDDCRPLQEAITASQGCMLLLVLKDHLKDLYGLSAAKISQYSPTDTSKVNERQVNRKANIKFEPVATLDILALGDPPDRLTDDQKKDLVQKYLQFKELMNKIDPDDENEEDAAEKGSMQNSTSSKTATSKASTAASKHGSSSGSRKAQHTHQNSTGAANVERSALYAGQQSNYHAQAAAQPAQQQAYIHYQHPMQAAQHLHFQPHHQRVRSTRAAAVAAAAAVTAAVGNDNLVLDPAMMVPVHHNNQDYCQDDNMQVMSQDRPFIPSLGQLKQSSKSKSTQDSGHVPKSKLPSVCRDKEQLMMDAKLNHKSHKKHHHQKPKKKKKKKHKKSDNKHSESDDSDSDFLN